MRKLGMQPILQGYSGMVPVDVQSKAKGAYALTGNDVIPAGNLVLLPASVACCVPPQRAYA